MSVYFIIALSSILLASLFLVLFIWSAKSGQFDDNFSSSNRLLMEDKPSEVKNNSK